MQGADGGSARQTLLPTVYMTRLPWSWRQDSREIFAEKAGCPSNLIDRRFYRTLAMQHKPPWETNGCNQLAKDHAGGRTMTLQDSISMHTREKEWKMAFDILT